MVKQVKSLYPMDLSYIFSDYSFLKYGYLILQRITAIHICLAYTFRCVFPICYDPPFVEKLLIKAGQFPVPRLIEHGRSQQG